MRYSVGPRVLRTYLPKVKREWQQECPAIQWMLTFVSFVDHTGMLCDVDIDDCDPSPCLNGTCTDRVDDFQCECDTGFQGNIIG